MEAEILDIAISLASRLPRRVRNGKITSLLLYLLKCSVNVAYLQRTAGNTLKKTGTKARNLYLLGIKG